MIKEGMLCEVVDSPEFILYRGVIGSLVIAIELKSHPFYSEWWVIEAEDGEYHEAASEILRPLPPPPLPSTEETKELELT